MNPISLANIGVWLLTGSLLLLQPTRATAQTPFQRNDNYDFRGVHTLAVSGNDIDHITAKIESDGDFRKFKVHVKTGTKFGNNSVWTVLRIKLDMNNDGVWDIDVESGNQTHVYQYPPPANGVSETHSVRVWLGLMNNQGLGDVREVYTSLTVLQDPRVYVSQGEDVFVQLKDEDCENRIPILLVEGIDVLNQAYPEAMYRMIIDLVHDDLLPRGYEVFVLNFREGARDIRLNAAVVSEALETIHALCPKTDITVVGLSMGGVVTRYALAKAESESIDHHVGLFVSYDAPQAGAHTSPDLQDDLKAFAGEHPVVDDLKLALQSTAAKQLMLYNTYDPTHVYRNEFFGELNSLNGDGYPHQCFNASISNGNMNASWGYESIGRHIMDFRIVTKAGDRIPLSSVNAVALDCGAGSLQTGFEGQTFSDDAFYFWYVFGEMDVDYELNMLFNPVYMPTWSTLHLADPQINQITGNIDSHSGSPFDDYVMQTAPLKHSAVSEATANRLLEWLGSVYPLRIMATQVSHASRWPGENAECNATVAGGEGGQSYLWEARNIGHALTEFPWESIGTGTSVTTSVADWYDRQVRVSASDGVSSVCDTLACIANLNSHAYPTVVVAGASALPAGASGTWTANAWEGMKCGDFPAREWRIRPHGSSTWSDVIGTGQTLMWPTYSATATDVQAKVLGEQWGTGVLVVWQSPGAVSDLAQEVMSPHEIWMTWTAPGIPGLTAEAIAYDVRVSEIPINGDVDFYAAPWVTCAAPGAPGQWEELIIPDLQCDHYYYIAMKVQDVSLAWSPISNVVRARTIGGALCEDPGYPGFAAGRGPVGSFDGSSVDENASAASTGVAASFKMEWQPNAGGGVLGIDVGVSAEGEDGEGVLTRSAQTDRDSTAEVGMDSGQWTTLGLALRSREERLELGNGWRPFGLPVTVAAADAGNRQYVVQRVSRSHEGQTEELGPLAWDGVFDLLVPGDKLRVEYTKSDSSAPDSSVSAWVLLSGPVGTDPLFGRTPQPTQVVDDAPTELELRLLAGMSSSTPVNFELGLPRAGMTRLEVLDVAGRRVRQIVNAWQLEGRHAVTWDGRDRNGQQVKAGVYFCRLSCGNEQATVKVARGGGH